MFTHPLIYIKVEMRFIFRHRTPQNLVQLQLKRNGNLKEVLGLSAEVLHIKSLVLEGRFIIVKTN